MTVKRIIAVTAWAAPTASARVATDVHTTAKPAGMAGIAAHHDQVAAEQWQRSARVTPVVVQSGCLTTSQRYSAPRLSMVPAN